MGETVFNNDTLLEPITTRAVEHKDAIAAVRAPVLANGKTGRESPIHVANVIRMSAVRARLNVDKPGHELGSGTGRELDSSTLNTESSSRPVSRPDRARVPVVDVNTVDHKATAARYGARAGVNSDSVESSAGGKRGKFDLRKSGWEPDSPSERAETGVHQSPMKSQLRNQNGTRNVTKIPRRTVMRYPEAIHREQTSTDTLIIIHYLHQEEQRRPLQTSAVRARLPKSGLRPVVKATG